MPYAVARPVVTRRRAQTSRAAHADPFEDVVLQHMRRVVFAAYRITENIDDAHDVAQHVFMQMYLKPPELENQRAVDRWLYVVTRNHALEIHRRRVRDSAAAELEGRDQPMRGLEETVIANERSREVRDTVAALPAAYRRIIELRHLLAMPETEVARELGIPRQRVKRDVEHAKMRLRRELQRRGLDADVR